MKYFLLAGIQIWRNFFYSNCVDYLTLRENIEEETSKHLLVVFEKKFKRKFDIFWIQITLLKILNDPRENLLLKYTAIIGHLHDNNWLWNFPSIPNFCRVFFWTHYKPMLNFKAHHKRSCHRRGYGWVWDEYVSSCGTNSKIKFDVLGVILISLKFNNV